MSSSEDVYLTSPLGPLLLQVIDKTIIKIDFISTPVDVINACANSAITQQLQTQFDSYFDCPNKPIQVDVLLQGTPFQLKVWKALPKIPVGEVMTYGQLAEQLNSSARAVGGALRANPCPIVYPCHRIVAKTGLGGFSGQTSGPKLSIKAWLLKHERLSL